MRGHLRPSLQPSRGGRWSWSGKRYISSLYHAVPVLICSVYMTRRVCVGKNCLSGILQMERLRGDIQLLCRYTNPMGRVMDYLQV